MVMGAVLVLTLVPAVARVQIAPAGQQPGDMILTFGSWLARSRSPKVAPTTMP